LAIDYEKRDGVAYITLHHPGKANILDIGRLGPGLPDFRGSRDQPALH
jgi:hypothetical protein